MDIKEFKIQELAENKANIHFSGEQGEMGSLALHVINDTIKTTCLYIKIIDIFCRENVSVTGLQHCILATWRGWFNLQCLFNITEKNNSFTFLGDDLVLILETLKTTLQDNLGVVMSHITQHTGFDSSFELYGIYQINGLSLKSSFMGGLAQDDDGFIAKCFEVPQLYGYGDTREEARQNLNIELSTLYSDLMEDDNFSPDFLCVKALFKAALS